MTSAAVWQILSNFPNWTTIAAYRRKKRKEKKKRADKESEWGATVGEILAEGVRGSRCPSMRTDMGWSTLVTMRHGSLASAA